MWARYTILLSGLLLWIEPAAAQKITIHPLTVSVHQGVRAGIEAKCRQLWHKDIAGCIEEEILKVASAKLQQGSATQAGCEVGFSLKGPIVTFTSAPPDIIDARTLEAVHRVHADVKIVRSIQYCVGEKLATDYLGCSWRPKGRRKTVIVIPPLWDTVDPVLWAHEYGHTTGLLHLLDAQNENLMTPCKLQAFNRIVNKNQCRHLIAGPVQRPPLGQGDPCTLAPSQND